MRIAENEREKDAAWEFEAAHAKAHFMQSREWAAVKSNWQNEIITADDGRGSITGMMSVFVRRIPVFGNLIYCPRGPVVDGWNIDALAQLTEGARELIKKYSAVGIRAEPDFEEGDGNFIRRMGELGWRTFPCKDAHDMIQPRSLFRLDLAGRTEEEVISGFHKKLRYNAGLAARRGVRIVPGVREDLDAFCRIMDVTAKRDGFVPRTKEYYYRIFDSFPARSCELLLAEYEGDVIAGGIFINHGGRTCYLYGASSDEHRSLMPCHLMHLEAIRRALSRGDDVYDLRGFLECTDDDGPGAGLYRFKKQFGGRLVRLVGEMYLTERREKYSLYRRTERIYRRAVPLLAKARDAFGQ